MNKELSFEVEGFNVIDDYSDNQLAIVEVYVCHDGNNHHNMPIDLSVIKKAKRTLKNKFLVAGFDGDDFEGHEPDEPIVGFFPESSEMKFVEKDGCHCAQGNGRGQHPQIGGDGAWNSRCLHAGKGGAV